MLRFIVSPSEIQNPEILLSQKESRHALTVLRLKLGANVGLIDGRGHEAHGIISEIRDGRVRVTSGGMTSGKNAEKYRTTLALSVIKPERMEWAIEKACELGVYAIFPVLTDRCVVKLSTERWQAKTDRWKKIAAEACKQCGLLRVPDIAATQPLKHLVKDLRGDRVMLVPTLAVSGEKISAVLAREKTELPDVLGWIGPEGDFTEKEINLLLALGGRAVSLGPLTLRSETAAVYLLSAVKFFYETY